MGWGSKSGGAEKRWEKWSEKKLIYYTKALSECQLCSGHSGVESLRSDTSKHFLKGRDSQLSKTGVMINTIGESQLTSFGES